MVFAAIVIQRAFRKYKSRSKLRIQKAPKTANMFEMVFAAITIQRAVRKYNHRLKSKVGIFGQLCA